MQTFSFTVKYSSGNNREIKVEAEDAQTAEELCGARMGRGTFVSRLDLETGKLFYYQMLTDSWIWVA